MVGFVDTTDVYSAIFQAVIPRLFPTELDLTSLTLAASVFHIVEVNLTMNGAPGVRENGIGWNVVNQVISQAELTSLSDF